MISVSVYLLSALPCTAQMTWVWQNPLPQGQHLYGISFLDAQFGVAVELEIVIDPENEGVHAARRQVLPDEPLETLDLRRRGRGNAQPPHGKTLIKVVVRAKVESLREGKEQGDQEALHDEAIIGSIPRPGQAGSADSARDQITFHAARRARGWMLLEDGATEAETGADLV